MMSEPACRLQHGGGRDLLDGLVVDDDAVAQDAVMAVAGEGVERHVGDDADLRHRRLDRARRAVDEVVRVEDVRAGLVAQVHVDIGEGGDAPECRAWRRVRASLTARSTDMRNDAGHGRRSASRRFSPSMMKIGQIRSSTVSRFSCTRRRDQSALRMRRRRRLPVISSTLRAPAGLAGVYLFIDRLRIVRFLACRFAEDQAAR